MSITPTGGWHRLQLRTDDEQFHNPVVCPSCYSSEWKAASLVHAEGLSMSKNRLKGSVIGVGRSGLRNGHWQIGGAQYQGTIRGTAQTVLSSMATPPKQRTGLLTLLGIAGILCGFAGIAHFQNGDVAGALFLGSLALASLWIFVSVRRRFTEEFEQAMEVYSSTRMCLRCGTFYEG